MSSLNIFLILLTESYIPQINYTYIPLTLSCLLIDQKIPLREVIHLQIRVNLTEPPITEKGESTGEPCIPKMEE